jgi:hypothetical protein
MPSKFQDLISEDFKLATLNINQLLGNDKRSESIIKANEKNLKKNIASSS